MIKCVTFASDVRTSALLCCSAALLLTACGGGVSGAGDSQPDRTASTLVDSANDSVATVVGSASVADLANPPALNETAGYSPTTTGQQGGPAPTRLLANVVSSSSADQVTALYQSLLGRDPDPAGLQYWAQAVDSGLSLDAVAAHIKAGAEYANRTASGATPAPSNTAIPATTYHLYVSSGGSDANPGSQGAPFRTITRAASAAKPSTTIHVAAGTYNETVKTSVKGTASARIYFVSDTRWGARIVGSGKEAMWTNNGNYIDIIGFDVTGSGRLGILNWGSYTSISGNKVHNLAVSGGCTGSGGAGIMNANYSGSDGDIVGNVVHDIGAPGSCNQVQGIYHANLRGKITNNIVYRAASYGIHLWHAANNVVIANNTSVANGSKSMGGGILIGAGDSPGGIVLDNTRVVNNLVAHNPRASIAEYCYSGQSCIGKNVTIANNLVYGNGSGISLKTGTHTGTITTDPQFVSYQAGGNGNYRLKSSSPAVNSGTSGYAPAVDIDSTARPKGGAVDIGAYENY